LIQRAERVLMTAAIAGPPEMTDATTALREWFNRDIHPDDALEPQEAMNCLKFVLMERKIGQAAQDLVIDMRQSGRIDYTGFAEDIQQQVMEIERIQHRRLQPSLPATWLNTSGDAIPVGVPFIDNLIGGIKPGDTNIILGPSGVAKTLMGIQMMCARAEAAYARELETGERGGVSVYISYEESMEALSIRTLSCGCQIDKDHVEAMHSYDDLSTHDNLYEYERKLCANNEPSCERERYNRNAGWINEYTSLIDFSNHPEAMGGNGGIPEIRGILNMVLEEKQRPLDSLYIDYAGLVCQRMLELKYGHSDGIVRELGGFVDKVNAQISKQFNTVTWVLHQVNGVAQKASPTVKLHHTSAEWCKAFANNAYLALVLGTKDQNSSACMLAATKTRRSETPKPIVCRIKGKLSKLADASNELTVDPHTHSLKPTGDVDRFHEAQAATQQRAPASVDQDQDAPITFGGVQ